MKAIKVVAAVIQKEGKVLCVQRGKSTQPYISEKWEFPGGKIEEGESEQLALIREIQEELRMDIVVGEKLMVVKHRYPDFHLAMHTYHVTSEDEPTLTEHQALQWVSPDELYALDWAAADLPIVKKISNGF
jgi:8-oxo-dGTP diphosphatase